MNRLTASIVKDLRILTRDRVGLLLMFVMPVLLVLVIATLQNNTFQLVNEHKISLLILNKDKENEGENLIEELHKLGMFDITLLQEKPDTGRLPALMQEQDALVALMIPENFSAIIKSQAESIAAEALSGLGVPGNNMPDKEVAPAAIKMYYSPVLQESYRYSIHGGLQGAVKLVENKQMLSSLYQSLNDEGNVPDKLGQKIINAGTPVEEIAVTRDGTGIIPNATQHNVPAWTVFAMFFIVTSLGSNIVNEKLSGSFTRLKTIPTSYFLSLLSKQITYLGVAMLQVIVIFAIGMWLFPITGLPALVLPKDIFALIIVSLIAGWCAVSYAICIGVYAQTQEQANGFGAVSVVILAAIGGIMVPAFAMPDSFRMFMMISPLHWCLEAYYDLFLERAVFTEVLVNILPLMVITVMFQILAYAGLKHKRLI